MFVDEMRRAIAATPKDNLYRLSGELWKAHAGGAIGDDDAQGLAEAIAAKKAAAPMPRRRVGSRPRTAGSMERRRRWVSGGMLPPQIAGQFTMGEAAALAVIASEVAAKGACKLTIGHIAALAGICRSTVKNAVRQAAALGFIRSEEWRLSAFRSAPNTVTIVALEWIVWLRNRRRGGAVKTVTTTHRLQKKLLSRPSRAAESAGERSQNAGQTLNGCLSRKPPSMRA